MSENRPPLETYLQPQTITFCNPIRIPAGARYDLKPKVLQLIIDRLQFRGISAENPLEHLAEFTWLYEGLKGENSNEIEKMSLFSYTLTDRAKRWFRQLPDGSITSWDQFSIEFLSEFYTEPVNVANSSFNEQLEGLRTEMNNQISALQGRLIQPAYHVCEFCQGPHWRNQPCFNGRNNSRSINFQNAYPRQLLPLPTPRNYNVPMDPMQEVKEMIKGLMDSNKETLESHKRIQDSLEQGLQHVENRLRNVQALLQNLETQIGQLFDQIIQRPKVHHLATQNQTYSKNEKEESIKDPMLTVVENEEVVKEQKKPVK